MPTPRDVYNTTRLRNLKRAKLKQKEAELKLYINKGYDDVLITSTMDEISRLKVEIKNLTAPH